MKIIPKAGIVGEVALREAATTEMRDRIELVRSTLADRIKLQLGKSDYWLDLEAIYPDRAVARVGGRFYAYPYQVTDDNIVTVGDPQEVVREFTPADLSLRESVALIEAVAGDKPNSFLIRVIRSGTSVNGKVYPPTVLREAAPLFNNVRVFIKGDEEHLEGKGKSVRNLIGGLREAVFVEGSTPDEGEIRAVLDVFESEETVAGKLREAIERQMSHLFGFSIDADGLAVRKGRLMEAKSFTKIHSVDLIVDPGAGGELIHLIEAAASQHDEDDAMKQRMLEAIRKANNGVLPAGLDIENEDAVFTAFKEATQPAAKPAAPAAPAATGDDQPITRAELQLMEVRTSMRESVRTSRLPEKAQEKLIRQLESDPALTRDKVTAAIKDEREYLASFTESGHVRGLGGGDGVGVGAQGAAEMLDKLLDRDDGDVISLREAYLEITGDSRFTGQLRECRFREATIETGTFPVLLGDAMHRRMLTYYAAERRYDLWREVVSDIVPLNDFRERNNILIGGYGDLPVVAQNDPYLELAEPSERNEKYAPTKRGGLSSVSLETIRNDEVGLVMRIPRDLATAAKRTLCKFVLDMIRTPPTMSDTKALFHADHGNLGTAAASKVAYLAARLAMMAQADHDTGEPLGLTPYLALFPSGLEETFFEMFRREENMDVDFAQSTMPKLRPVWYWTDPSDWALIGNPLDHPTIEIGFLDGKQDPEIFIQDAPSQGSMFSHDRVTYKLRHIYGGGPSDYLNMRKHVVADA